MGTCCSAIIRRGGEAALFCDGSASVGQFGDWNDIFSKDWAMVRLGEKWVLFEDAEDAPEGLSSRLLSEPEGEGER